MTQEDRYDKVISAIRAKAQEVLPEGSEVTLFGSRARGDARPDSDWDIHILVPGPAKLPIDAIGDYSYPFVLMGLDIDEEINPVVHSFEGWKLRWFLPLYHNIENEGIKI